MTHDQWIEFLEERIANRERQCEEYGWELHPDDACATFAGRSARGIGVRPECVMYDEGGQNVYMLTYKQAKKALKIARAAS
jgi:hypothetical protein